MALGRGIEDLALRQRGQKQANGAAGGKALSGAAGVSKGTDAADHSANAGTSTVMEGLRRAGGGDWLTLSRPHPPPVPASLTPLRFIAIWRTITRLWRRFAVAGGAVKLTG